MANDVAVYDAEMLKFLNSMANKDDAGGTISGPPILKINYDADSKYNRGEWVVGQKKDKDGTITEEGELVKGLVLLLVQNRWSYYDQKDTKANCNSPFFLRGMSVRGSNYGYVCGRTCPKRADGINPRCKCQIVLFGKAVTPEGGFIDCIGYISGDSYMPVQNYISQIERAKVKGGYIDIPLFARLTLLGAVKKQNEGAKYFQADLTPGPMFKDRDQLLGFKQARDEAVKYVERCNTSIDGASSDKSSAGMDHSGAIPVNAVPVNAVPVNAVPANAAPVDAPPLSFAEAITGGTAKPPWETEPVIPEPDPAKDILAAGSDGDGFDLIGAIDKLINK